MQGSGRPAGILFVSSVSGLGGAEFTLVELATHLDRSRFTPYLVVEQEGPLPARFRQAGIDVLHSDFPFFSRRRPWRYTRSIWKLVSIIRSRRIALVHVNCDRAIPHSVLAARLARAGCVCYVHDMLRAWFLPHYVRRLNHADLVVAGSKATAARCCEAGINASRVRVVYECFEMERYTRVGASERRQFRQEFGLRGDDVAIGLVGQVLRYKGHEEFVRAAAMIHTNFPSARFFVVGDDSMAEDKGFLPFLRNLAIESGLGSKMIFTGFRSDIPTIMAGLDIVTVPSWEESFGRTVVEALASSRPVVASKIGGIPEIFEDGHGGLFVPPRDYNALADRLAFLCKSPEERKRLGSEGPTIAARFDVNKLVERFQDLYASVLVRRDKRLGHWNAHQNSMAQQG